MGCTLTFVRLKISGASAMDQTRGCILEHKSGNGLICYEGDVDT